MPVSAPVQGKRPAAADIGKASADPVQAPVPAPVQPVQKDAPSAFNQLVAQIVAEWADPGANPTPAVQVPAATPQTAKLPPKPTGISTVPVRAALAPLTDTLPLTVAPAGGRRADTRGTATSSAGGAQPPSVPVDVNIPIPVAPKLQLPSFAGGGSVEQKPAAILSAAEPDPLTLEPPPILDVKIHLNQPVTEPSFVQSTLAAAVVATPVVSAPVVSAPVVTAPVVTAPLVTAPVVSAPVVSAPVVSTPVVPASPVATSGAAQSAVPVSANHGAQDQTPGQQNPERGSPDTRDADTGPVPGDGAHAVPRAAGKQEAVVIVQQQERNAGPTQLPTAHDTAAAPVAAVPTAPALEAVTARDARPEPQASSAPLREESGNDQPHTQQPLRSLSLEFAPDGAGDIKVRLSERAGDVHISLHGTDPSLAVRVREGVSDLVGSLSKAGYDAEAWTPGQGRQNQRQQPDQRQSHGRASPGDPGAEEFSGILQPIQEIS